MHRDSALLYPRRDICSLSHSGLLSAGVVRVGARSHLASARLHFVQAADRRQARLLPAVCSANLRSWLVMYRTVSGFGVVSTNPAPSVAGAVWHPVREKLKAQSPVIKVANFSIVLCPFLEEFGGALGNLAFNGCSFRHTAFVVADQVRGASKDQPTRQRSQRHLCLAPPWDEEFHQVTHPRRLATT